MSELLTILNLPWEDIICKKILGHLNIKEVYRLKGVSKSFIQIVQYYMIYFCKKLDFTSVGSKKKFTSDVFLHITANKMNIHQLNFKNCHHWLKDNHLIPVLKSNPLITDLYATECYGLSDVTFICISEDLSNLRNLDLSFCRDLSNEAMVCIGKSLHQLCSLNISGCWLVNDNAIITLAVNNPNLENLHAKSCYTLTDVSMTAIARNCCHLKVLDIQGCWRVKDPSIIAIREYCKHLKELYVKDCNGITEISLARLRPRGVQVDIEMPVYRSISSPLSINQMPLLQI